MVHCMSGILFGCIVWCPSAFTSLSGLESCPLGSNGLFHVFVPPLGFTMPTVWPSCATYLFSCLEQSSLDVVPDILSGPISYTCRCAHMQVEDLLEMIACLRVFKLPNFEARGELALGFWRHINPHVTYKKLMLQSYFLTRDHFYTCDKFAHGPTAKGWSLSVWLCFQTGMWWDGCHVSWNMCSQEAGQMLGRTLGFSHLQHLVPACHIPSHHALPCIQCLHGQHGRSNLHMGSEILMLGSWQSQHPGSHMIRQKTKSPGGGFIFHIYLYRKL